MRVTAYGGISVLNAIPLGLGSTCAIDLTVEVEAFPGGGERSSRLVETILDYFRKETGKDFHVRIHSDIPVSGGLKSSSAVATAAISSLSELTGHKVDVPVLAAKLSIEAGVSVTGALDDATAAFYGCLSVCDNTNMKIIRRARFPSGYVFVVLPRGHRRDFDPEKLQRAWPSFKAISGMVMMGDYLGAMAKNGLTVSEILGYETDVLLEALKLGAKASGVTGNGPSLFAVVKEGDETPLVDLFSAMGKPIIARAV